MAWLLDSSVLLLSFSSRKCKVLVLPNLCHGFSVDAVISHWLGVSRTINEHLAWSWAWQEQECSPQIHIPSASLRFQALMYLGGTMWLVLTNGLWPAVMCIIFETKHLIADARPPSALFSATVIKTTSLSRQVQNCEASISLSLEWRRALYQKVAWQKINFCCAKPPRFGTDWPIYRTKGVLNTWCK